MRKKPEVPELSPEQQQRLAEVVQAAIKRFSGGFDELEAAIGMYVLGHYVGWKVLALMHTKKTISKYEQILGIEIRQEFQERGTESERSLGLAAAEKLSNFWKIVSGESKLDLSRDERKHLKGL